MSSNIEEKINILGSRYKVLMDKIFSDLDSNEKKIIIESVDTNDLDYLLYLTSYDIKDLNNIILFLEAVVDSAFNKNLNNNKLYKMKRSKFLFNSILVVVRYINLDYLNKLKLNGNMDIYKSYIKDSYFFYEKSYYMNPNLRDSIYKELSDYLIKILIDKGIEEKNIQNEIINYFKNENYFFKLYPLKLFVKDSKFDNGIGMDLIINRLNEILNYYLSNYLNLNKDNVVTLEDVENEFRFLNPNELKEIFKNVKTLIRTNKKEKLDLEKLYKYEEKVSKNLYKIVYDVLLTIDKDRLLKGEELRLNLKVSNEVFNSYLDYNKKYFSYLEKEYIAKQISIHLLEHFDKYPINISNEIKKPESILRKYVKYIVLTELYEDSSSYYKIKEIDLLNYEKLFSNVPKNVLEYYETKNLSLLSNKKFIDFKFNSYFESFRFILYGLNYLNDEFLKFISHLENSETLMKDYLDGIINLTYKKSSFVKVLNETDKSNYLKGKGSLDDKLELYIFLKNKVNTSHVFDWFKLKYKFLEDNSISEDIASMYKNESKTLLNNVPEEKDVMRMYRFTQYFKKYSLESNLLKENNSFLNSVSSLIGKISFDKSNRFFSLKVSDDVILIFGYRFIILKTSTNEDNYKLSLIYKTPGEISTYKGFLLSVSYAKQAIIDIKKDNKLYNDIDIHLLIKQIDCIYKIVEESWDLRKSPLDESLIKNLENSYLNQR